MAADSLQWRPVIVAHRGGVAWKPYAENSAEGFADQVRDGFLNECDVQASLDGEPVVIHDPTMDRTTTATGKVADFNSADLRRVVLRNPMGGHETIPLLRDVRDLVSLVEIKPPDAPTLVRRVIEIMHGLPWTLISFDEKNLLHARDINPSIRTALLVDEFGAIDTAIDGRWSTYLDHGLADDRVMGRLQDAGLTVGVWTVNTEDELHHVVPWRPDLIISDMPRVIRRWLQKSGVAT